MVGAVGSGPSSGSCGGNRGWRQWVVAAEMGTVFGGS